MGGVSLTVKLHLTIYNLKYKEDLVAKNSPEVCKFFLITQRMYYFSDY